MHLKLMLIAVTCCAAPVVAHASCTNHSFQVSNASSQTLEISSPSDTASLQPGETFKWTDFAHYTEYDHRAKTKGGPDHYTQIFWDKGGSSFIGCNVGQSEYSWANLNVVCNYYSGSNPGYTQVKDEKAIASNVDPDRTPNTETGLCEGCQSNSFSVETQGCQTQLTITDENLTTEKE